MPNSGYVFDAWSDGVLTATRTDTNVTADKTVNAIFLATIVTAPIAGIAVPVSGEIPTATIADTVEYTATISWDTDPVTFASDTIYTATVIITPKAGYTLTGISEDFFTVAGATATNSVDSGIVSAVFPATASSWACGDVLIDSRDSYSYSTVLIDTQCWLAKNLAYLPSVVPSATGDSTDPYYYVYDYQGTDVATAKLETNYINYGALYNYPAALNSCPSGWHLPTDAEWTTLSTYAGGDLEAAGKLKASVTDEIPFDGTNDFNFSAIPSGTRYAFDGTFGEIGDAGSNYLWSSSIDEPDSALTLLLISGDIELIRYPDYRANGYSVRCIKD
jgi:uncharacterized protein (TIGR02145 family)